MSGLIALESIELQLYTDDEVRKIAVVQVTNPSTYDRGLPKANGVNDPRMGVTDKALQCPTCGLTATCNNHYGFVELEKPILRLGHIPSTLCILRSVCWACSRPKFSEQPKDGYVDIRAVVSKTSPGSKDRLRGISEACKNRFKCPWEGCGAPQPVYSRVNKVFFGRNFRPKEASLFTCEEERIQASKRLLPDEIQSIFRHIPYEALIVMGYRPDVSHPQHYVFKAQLVPPPSIRPATSAASTEARMRGENDLTAALQDMVRANNELAACLALEDHEKSQVAWDKLQIFAAAIINQNAKKLNTFNGTTVVHARAMGKRKTKVIKDRLTGKKGRLRGNLSGKRVDQAGRTVVGPDASHDIYELGVPSSIMRVLTFPEHVNDLNKKELAAAIIRGAGAQRGALTVRQSVENADEKVLHISLLDLEGRKVLAASLKPGWTVERHLRDGDWVLFNRQPSLHKASIMAFQAYETRGLQFKLPLPCTKPFNADFDGDEMNIHALQDYTAIAEAQEIMSVPHQMVTPQNNSVIIALVQDSIVGAYMMSRKDAFANRDQAMQLAMCIHHSTEDPAYEDMPGRSITSFIDDLKGFPTPAILKGYKHGKVTPPMWTGKQILSWALPKKLSLVKAVNGGDPQSVEDIWDEKVVIVRKGEILSGRLCKQTVGNSSGGIVQALWKQIGPWPAAKFVSDAQRILMDWLRSDTICISIRDCLTPCESQVDEITAEAMGKADALGSADIPAAIRELRQTQILQETLRNVGAAVLETMDTSSGIATVVASGSKGNLMNIAQIAGLVGQQTINGSRIAFRRGPSGLRTLANFSPGDNSPEARGFVASSYMMGLQPSEFFFHQQAGREGVVATAVSTADTGYNQRRMVKNQESEVVGYDLSVRVSSNLIVQQHYGGDDYDGTMVERIRLSVLDMPTEKAMDQLTSRATSPQERAWIKKSHGALLSILKSVYGGESSKDICMPCNFSRILSSIKVGASDSNGQQIAKPSRVLRNLLLAVFDCHGSTAPPNASIDELIFWNSRDWRKEDDTSMRARLCLALQCTSVSLKHENLMENEEEMLVSTFRRLYLRGIVNPGEGVGAVGSSSIGEPSTQMTLNIFHYSGIAEKNVTLTGLPRFKQIINAVDTYETSNMRIRFHLDALGSSTDVHKYNVRALSSRLVRTALSQIVSSSRVEESNTRTLAMLMDNLTAKTSLLNTGVDSGRSSKAIDARITSVIGVPKRSNVSRLSNYVAVYVLNKSAMLSRHLSVDDIGAALAGFLGSEALVTWSAKWENGWLILVRPPTWGDPSHDKVVTEAVHDALMEQASVNGIESIKKAVPSFSEGSWLVETEGSDMIEVAQLSEVDALQTTTNNIQEVARVLGVEAALCLMQSELHRVLSFDGSYVDPRHTWLLSDTVARSGGINPLNRHKMEELGGSLLQCASFEQTLDVFEHGAAFGKQDTLGGATEKLIVGQPVNVGTGSFAILETVDDTPSFGTFVAPLSYNRDEFEDESTFVAAIASPIFGTNHPDAVQPLKTASKPAYERVIPIYASAAFKPPSEIPDSPLSKEDASMAESFIPLVAIMRRQAQLCVPVWIVANVHPTDEDSMSMEEFGDIEAVLESYIGWLHRPRGGNFVQFTEVDYEIEDRHFLSRVEYCTAEIRATHRIQTTHLKVESPVPEPMDAWSTTATAVTWQEISSDDLPTTVTPTKVRISQEKIFEKGAWIIRLSRRWSAQNIVEAEKIQRGGSKTCDFKLSIEMVKPWDLMEERGGTDMALCGGIVQRVLSCLRCIKEDS